MKQTNYHLFDFMDFDPDLGRDEVLWKAWSPSSVKEKDGDILITIPFQRQKHQEDMAPDNDVPQRAFTLVVRAYGPRVLRLFITMAGDEMVEEDDMLQMQVRHTPLHLEDGRVVDADGRCRVAIDLQPPVLDPWSDLLPAPQPAPRITFFPDGDEEKPVALSDDHFSPPRYDALPIGFVETGGGAERATISFQCSPGECFAGTGERFRKMDLSGQTFQLKNQDAQGVNNRRCYKNIPFFLSSRMYGAFYHTSDYCKLSLADHSTRSVQFLCDRATLDVFLVGGRTPEEVLRGYRMLTGFPQMPPLWSFGIWMSRMTYFSAEEVEDICQRLRREHFPCDVIHLDTGWFRTDWLCEWKFNPERFPDPEGFIQRLASQGFKVSLWQLPYVAKGAEQLDEAREHRYIAPLRKEQATEGSNFSALDYAGTIDFTNPDATAWYQGLLRRLLKMGVKCIKTDFGENIHMDADYHAMSPERLNNLYALLYQRAAYEVTREVTGEGVIWARAAWAGCQRYPLHWGGDSASTWDGMAGSLKGGLHLGLSGFAFWSHDVPGFHSVPDFMNSPLDPQVYVRWTQMGVFTSHLRYHGTCKREPWHYPDIAPIVKKWWKFRYRLIPYIVEQARKACAGGMPMVQALLIRHPYDRQCWHVDDEYYFGRDFLVCPVMDAKGRRDIYLPEGMWVEFFTGERWDGGRWYERVETPLERMPVFVRPGAIIPLYPDDVDSTDDMDLSKTIHWNISKDYKGYDL
ncbi:MAG: alpha-xylosidase [Prevotella sp.]|nr:alpha-xylosidase [Prevotella sp.]